jgi:hypothetical protein
MTRRRFVVAHCGQKHDASDGTPFKHDCHVFDVKDLLSYAAEERRRQQPFCTSFCNKSHDLKDGKPIDHECYILRTDILEAEFEGFTPDEPAPIEPRKTHKGKKTYDPTLASRPG